MSLSYDPIHRSTDRKLPYTHQSGNMLDRALTHLKFSNLRPHGKSNESASKDVGTGTKSTISQPRPGPPVRSYTVPDKPSMVPAPGDTPPLPPAPFPSQNVTPSRKEAPLPPPPKVDTTPSKVVRIRSPKSPKSPRFQGRRPIRPRANTSPIKPLKQARSPPVAFPARPALRQRSRTSPRAPQGLLSPRGLRPQSGAYPSMAGSNRTPQFVIPVVELTRPGPVRSQTAPIQPQPSASRPQPPKSILRRPRAPGSPSPAPVPKFASATPFPDIFNNEIEDSRPTRLSPPTNRSASTQAGEYHDEWCECKHNHESQPQVEQQPVSQARGRSPPRPTYQRRPSAPLPPQERPSVLPRSQSSSPPLRQKAATPPQVQRPIPLSEKPSPPLPQQHTSPPIPRIRGEPSPQRKISHQILSPITDEELPLSQHLSQHISSRNGRRSPSPFGQRSASPSPPHPLMQNPPSLPIEQKPFDSARLGSRTLQPSHAETRLRSASASPPTRHQESRGRSRSSPARPIFPNSPPAVVVVAPTIEPVEMPSAEDKSPIELDGTAVEGEILFMLDAEAEKAHSSPESNADTTKETGEWEWDFPLNSAASAMVPSLPSEPIGLALGAGVETSRFSLVTTTTDDESEHHRSHSATLSPTSSSSRSPSPRILSPETPPLPMTLAPLTFQSPQPIHLQTLLPATFTPSVHARSTSVESSTSSASTASTASARSAASYGSSHSSVPDEELDALRAQVLRTATLLKTQEARRPARVTVVRARSRSASREPQENRGAAEPREPTETREPTEQREPRQQGHQRKPSHARTASHARTPSIDRGEKVSLDLTRVGRAGKGSLVGARENVPKPTREQREPSPARRGEVEQRRKGVVVGREGAEMQLRGVHTYI